MVRSESTGVALLAIVLAGFAPVPPDEDMRTASEYLQGLRNRGYYDLAEEYLEGLRTQPRTPDELKSTIDYEQGRLMIDEASKTGDLVLRKDLLDKARAKLAAFTKNNPKHPLATEALVQLARLLVERGHTAVIQSGDATDPKEKQAKLAEARTSFNDARTAYTKADEMVTAAFNTFPHFINDNDPKKAERERTHTAMMNAQLQKAVVDYEQGETFPLGSAERTDYLAKALAQFEDVYKRYRTQFAGLTARMYQAKCFEEKGDIGPALGIYNELLEHQDPRLRPLQRNVAYFKIIAHAKRKEYALAADLASAWLQHYNSPDEHRLSEGLGVQLELAKNILAQMPELNERDKSAAIRRVVDVLSQVVRVSSPYKAEALEILKKYKPREAANAESLARMGYDELSTQADQAVASHEWDKAITILKLAIKKADPVRDIDKANLARYQLALSYYMNKQYYEADVLAEHLARRYPRFGMAPMATKIAMGSLADAYNASDIDRASDLERLVRVANYTVETWPDKDEGDDARMTLGMIHHGLGQYPKAIAAYDSVRPKGARWVEAKTRAGASHWEESKVLRKKGDAKGADAEVNKALATLNTALKARREAGTAATDADLIGNVCDIATIDLDTGKTKEALALLEPSSAAVMGAGTATPAVSRLLSDLLRAHINGGQIEKALADMAALERMGGGANLTQLYFGLGKLLETELKTLKEKNNRAGLERRQADYLRFLTALAGTKSGQTYESLRWTGEQMLKIQNPKAAGEIFKRILDTTGKDKAFLGQPGADERLFKVKVRYAQALREQDDFTAAESVVQELLKDFPKRIEPLYEQGMLLENKAENKQATWKADFAHWQTLALRLRMVRPAPIEYYDAWYHAAYALFKDKQATKAKQTLGSVMRLSPKVGSPEMKEKYDALLKQIK